MENNVEQEKVDADDWGAAMQEQAASTAPAATAGIDINTNKITGIIVWNRKF